MAEVKAPKAKRKPVVSHAAVVKADLLNAVADALGGRLLSLIRCNPRRRLQ